jgi:collagen type III alpha
VGATPRRAEGDKKGSNANSDEDTDDDDYTDDDYDEDYYDDDYSDDDYADLHDFFSQPPPGWRGPPGFRAPKGGSAGGWFGNATGKGSHSG